MPSLFPLLILPFQQKTSRKDVNIKIQKIKAICHVELDLFTVRNPVPFRSPLESLKIRKLHSHGGPMIMTPYHCRGRGFDPAEKLRFPHGTAKKI